MATESPPEEPRTASAPRPEAATGRRISEGEYRVLWRWHFYAGMLCAPFLLTTAVTGAIYAFNLELTTWLYRDLQVVQPTGTPLPFARLLEIGEKAAAGHEIEGFFLSRDPTRAVQFVAHLHVGGDDNPEQVHGAYHVDPYTGKYLGMHVMERTLTGWALQIHRSLCAGMTGRILIEASTCWGIVLLLTGTYLWWPRGKKRLWGVWLPRLGRGGYVLLRDLHALAGVYSVVFLFLVMATGLFFSQVWGTGYFMTAVATGQADLLMKPAESRPGPADRTPAPLDAVVAAVVGRSRPDDRMLVQLAPEPKFAHRAFLFPDEDRNRMRMVAVDRYTAEVLSVHDMADFPPMMRLRALAVSIHTGQIFGLPTKILALLTCLVLGGLVVTGVWMWWERRPTGTWGIPRGRPRISTLPWSLILTAVGLGIVMPVFGLTLLLVTTTDFAVAWWWSGPENDGPENGRPAIP